MITKEDLLEGIAECQGQRNPNANTCLKLASFYTILDHIDSNNKEETKYEVPQYSGASSPQRSYSYESDSEFGKLIKDIDDYTVLELMDELMSTLSVVEPRLYSSVMRKLRGEY